MILTRPLAEEFFARRCVGEFSSLQRPFTRAFPVCSSKRWHSAE